MKTNTTTAATTKAPTHVAYQVKNREGKKAIGTRIGRASEARGHTPTERDSTSNSTPTRWMAS